MSATERLRVVLEIADLTSAGSQVVVTAAVQLFGPQDPVDVVLHLTQDGEPTPEQAEVVLGWCVSAVPTTDQLPDVVLVTAEEARSAPAAVQLVAPADLADAARSVALLTAAAQSVWDSQAAESAVDTAADAAASVGDTPADAGARTREEAALDRARAQLLLARRDVRSAVDIARERRRPTVVGLFQHVSYWPAVEDVYRGLDARADLEFVPVALESTVDRRSGGVADFLAAQGLRPRSARWLIEHLGDVDAVVLENPYDETRPWQLTVPALARHGIRLVGLPYGNNAIDGSFMTRLLWDMPLHRYAWRYYLPSPSQRALYAEHCAAGDEPVRVLGNPKHDRLVPGADGAPARPLSPLAASWRELAGERPVVVWNPHFRTGPGGWSTFPRYVRQLTAYAQDHPDVVLVVRPHFRLFGELRAGGLGRLERDLRSAATALPNVVLDESPDYRDALAVADAVISDLSSLASEFLVTGRPLLYLHRADGPGPSSEGGYLESAARAETWQDVERFLDDVRAGRDPHAEARRAAVTRAFPFLDGGCAARVVDDIARGLLDDLAAGSVVHTDEVAERPAVVDGGRAQRFSTPTAAALATARTRSLRDEVVLTSFDGRSVGGNPLAIANELQRVGHSARRWWVVDRPGGVVPEGCEPMLAGTPEHHEALSRARWVVDNDATAPWFERRPGQTVLQTWHGTPLKRLRFDLHEVSPRSPETLRLIEHQARQWSYVVSANSLTSQVLRRGFRYDGEILEVGYPRNDVLADPERLAETRRRVRAAQGVRDDQLVVLYAPTWRDDAMLGEVGGAVLADQPTLDWAGMRSVLGERAVLWLRAHRFVSQASGLLGGAGVVDLSAYPDMADLLAAADVLVTDYSSSFFDFALTGRPMVFYTPDLEHYRGGLRGHYFRMEDVVPGPVLADAHRVTEAVATLDSWRAGTERRYRQFLRTFAPWDDGKAAQRVVEAVFS
jgi:CDP-glycerol glycerophosphotransferase (TagB/SpsB family)